MHLSLRSAIVATLTVAALFSATAHAEEAAAASSVGDKAKAVASKVGTAVKHGAHTAASAVGHGMTVAASAVDHGTKVAGQAINKTAHKVLPASSAASSTSR